MDRIQHPSATLDHEFTEGNPSLAVPATTVTATWLNGVQEELVHLIEEAGLTPDETEHHQVREALDILYVPATGLAAVEADLAAETAAREAADEALQTTLDSVAAAGITETANRTAADVALALSIAEVGGRVVSSAIPRTGAGSFQWWHSPTLTPSDDALLGVPAPSSRIRYGDGVLSLSLQLAISRAAVATWNPLSRVELRVATPGPALASLLAVLQAGPAWWFPATLTFPTGDARTLHVMLHATTGPGAYIYAHLSAGSPQDGGYSNGQLVADCDVDRDGSTAASVSLHLHASLVLPGA